MATSPTSLGYGKHTSRRFRANISDELQVSIPTDLKLNSGSRKILSASPTLKKVGVKQLDIQTERIEKLSAELRYSKSLLAELILEFMKLAPDNTNDLQKAVAKLRTLLEPYTWKLERPRRYLMQLMCTGLEDQCLASSSVILFNRINELCCQLIRRSVSVKELVKKYQEDQKQMGKMGSPPRASQTFSVSCYILDPTTNVTPHEIKERICEMQEWETNANSAKLLEKEAEEAITYGRKIFYELVSSCANCLMQVDG